MDGQELFGNFSQHQCEGGALPPAHHHQHQHQHQHQQQEARFGWPHPAITSESPGAAPSPFSGSRLQGNHGKRKSSRLDEDEEAGMLGPGVHPSEAWEGGMFVKKRVCTAAPVVVVRRDPLSQLFASLPALSSGVSGSEADDGMAAEEHGPAAGAWAQTAGAGAGAAGGAVAEAAQADDMGMDATSGAMSASAPAALPSGSRFPGAVAPHYVPSSLYHLEYQDQYACDQRFYL